MGTQILRSPAAVLFDLDGTLVDSAPDMLAAYRQLCEEKGFPMGSLVHLRNQISHGAKGLLTAGLPDLADDEFEWCRQRFLAIYASRLCVDSKLFAGVVECLAYLRGRAIPWGIVTNKAEVLARPLAISLGLSASIFVAGDTLVVSKPHPEPLLWAAKGLRVPASACIYVGDAEKDMVAAQAAGMSGVVAHYGYIQAHESPFDWPSHGHIHSMHELVSYLDGYGTA